MTAKAKIRNSAIAHFAREGFQKANLRAIATAAGVSEALVFHHFGSKHGLRTACDEYMLNVLVERTRAAGSPSARRDLLGIYLSNPDEYMVYVQYIVRAIHDDAPAASTLVDTLVEESEAIVRAGAADGTMRPSADPRALAVLNVLISLAVLTMPPALARALGSERFGPDVLQRISVPTFELFTRGIYTDDTLVQGARDAWTAARSPQQEEN
ncbi:TetR family transcriptional regulator [Nocardia sp. NPDC052112]|uniref:TetR family transcriptional regulator n=1 Tax=Nocardia sp. NPDC052112 TaxID=3155646 RepID=UPI00343F54CB